MRIREHGLDQIALDVWRTREAKVVAAAMFPVPIVAGFVRAGVVDLVLSELQVFTNISVEGCGKRASDRCVLRIVFGKLAKEIVAVAGEAGVEAASGQTPAAPELFHELRKD